MQWLTANINHFTVPLGIMLGLFAVAMSFYGQRKRKQGANGPVISGGALAGAILFIVCCAVLFGIAIAHHWG